MKNLLRDYQIQALDEIRDCFRVGKKRVLLHLPTGAGKTTVFCEVLKLAAERGNPGLMVVRGRKLVDQASARLSREGVEHGIIMAGDKRSNPLALVQCASIDTLYSRKIVPACSILVIDECHLALNESFDWLLSQLGDVFIIAVSATPFHPRGFEHMADEIVAPITARELIDKGYLVPARYYVPGANTLDLSTVKRSKGDYVQKDLGNLMNQSRLFGPVVDTWKRLGENKPTLLFAVNVSHSKRLCEAFNAAGVSALHIDAKSTKEEREHAFRLHEGGDVKVLCTVNLCLVGTDLPWIKVISVCRPTLNFNVHAQMLGRGSRPCLDKAYFTVLDHTQNVITLGMYETHREASLKGRPPIVSLSLITCERCYAAYERGGSNACPGLNPDGTICGHIPPPPKIRNAGEIKTDAETPLGLILSEEQLEKLSRDKWIKDKCLEGIAKGYKKGWAYMQIKKRFGESIARGAWKILHEAFRS